MILYITNSKKTNLLDFLDNQDYQIQKLDGTIDMKNFVVRDMSNYMHITETVIHREAVVNNDTAFAEAIEEFYTMYSARITVIYEGLDEDSPFFKQLLHIGVANIVVATDLSEIRKDIQTCLSIDGLKKYQANERVMPVSKNESYHFDCTGVKIGIIGSQARIGTTTMALGLTYWLGEVGATSCYVETVRKSILPLIAREVGAEHDSDGSFKMNGSSYSSNDNANDFNFSIFDFGNILEANRENLNDMDIWVLVCGCKTYELPYSGNCLKIFGDTNAYIIPAFATEELAERLNIGSSNVEHEVLQPMYQPDFTEYSESKQNYKKIVERYIATDR